MKKGVDSNVPGLKELERQIQALRTKTPDGIAALYGDVFATQIKILAGLDLRKNGYSFSLPNSIALGKPLLCLSLPSFVPELAAQAAADLVAIADRHAALMTKITGSPPSSPTELLRRVQDYLDYLHAHYGLVVWRMPHEERKRAAEALETFLSFAALAPAYAYCARLLEENYDLFTWGESFCPVCGLLPTMAKLLPEAGTRVAECWLCGTQWAISRLTCPYCGNSDPERLEVIYREEDPTIRAHLCRECHRYVKVVDVARKGKEVVLALENLASSHLDQIMHTMGYMPGDDGAVLPGFPRW